MLSPRIGRLPELGKRGNEVSPDTNEVLPDCPVVLPDSPELGDGRNEVLPDTNEVFPDRHEVLPDSPELGDCHNAVFPDTNEVLPDGPEVLPDRDGHFGAGDVHQLASCGHLQIPEVILRASRASRKDLVGGKLEVEAEPPGRRKGASSSTS